MDTKLPLLCYFEGKIIPLSEAKIGILTHAFSYGTGCFEGIRAYWNEEHGQLYGFRVREHYERMHESTRVLMMEMRHSPEELEELTNELLRQSGLYQDAYIRPMAYKADEVIGVRLHNLRDELYITVQPFGNYIDIDRALKVGVSSWKRIDDNMIPPRAKITGAYVNSAFAKSEAQMNGFDEAIMLDSDGHVSEGSAENLFMLRNGVACTPPVTASILEGITRNTITTLLRDELGIPVVERTIDRTELYVCDELILCGTGAQIAPVGSIDHRPIGNGGIGEVGRALQDLYFDVVKGNVPKYRHWCSPVHNEASLRAETKQMAAVS
ncbi:MAG TPA: branched-chain amino acid transaminase [Chloroflexia bacterium]|nr:branched-chain amino acid transaminase [Chloroflexia bacterium]